jgi:drug/metabolite transporter (DMT)-like permease
LVTARWKDDPRLAYLLVNLATFFWASNIALGRALRGQIGPITLTALRFSIAGLIFAVLVSKFQPDRRQIGANWKYLLAMGLTGVFTFPSLLYFALQRTTATNASLINALGPLSTALLAALLLNETFTIFRFAGALISLIGVAFVIGAQILATFQTSAEITGNLIVLLDVIIWGVYSILSRIVTRYNSALVTTAYSIWFAVPFLLGAAYFEWQASPPEMEAHVILAVFYIALFPSLIAFLSWNEGIRRIGPARSMAFYNMLPVYGALLGMMFLGEKLDWTQIIGGSMVILGALIATRT